MEVKNGRIVKCEIMSDDELILRKRLKDALENWFGLQLDDIPEIMKKIGIRSKNYEILPAVYSNDSIYFAVKTKSTEYLIEVFRGNMISPYPFFKVSKEGKEKYFSVKKIIKVERFE